jgi:hypothetical protein
MFGIGIHPASPTSHLAKSRCRHPLGAFSPRPVSEAMKPGDHLSRSAATRSCAPWPAAIERRTDRERRAKGEWLLSRFHRLQERTPLIGDARSG